MQITHTHNFWLLIPGSCCIQNTINVYQDISKHKSIITHFYCYKKKQQKEKIHLKTEIFAFKTNTQYHNNSTRALKPMLNNVHTTWKQVDNFHRLIISKDSIHMKSCTCIDENEIGSQKTCYIISIFISLKQITKHKLSKK